MGSNPTQGSFFFEKRESCPGCVSLPLLACHVYTCTCILYVNNTCLQDEDEWDKEHLLISGELHHTTPISQVVQGQRLSRKKVHVHVYMHTPLLTEENSFE